MKFIKNKFLPGSIKGSIFTLTTAVIGAGLISLPNLKMQAG